MQRRLYLASQSPRRLELLRQIGIDAMVLPLRHQGIRADINESPLAGEAPNIYVVRLAHMKAEVAAAAMTSRRLPAMPIVAADTTVVVDGMILGKPASEQEAVNWLRTYSGSSHKVYTGVAVAWANKIESALSISTVRFRELSEAEIMAYVASRDPMDKAGGYGIQGRAAMFIEHIEGSYSGIMGLPLFETAELIRKAGLDIL